MNLVIQTFACLVATLLAIVVAAGWGMLCALLIAGAPPRRPATLPFLGFAFLATLWLPVWHLAAPIDRRALIAVLAGGVAGCALYGRKMPAWRIRPLAIGIVLAIATFGALSTLRPTASYDTAAYHLPVVEWTRQHSIVVGLGNLDPLFGLNNSSLLIAALWAETGLPHWIGCPNFALFALLLGLIAAAAWPAGEREGSLVPAILLFPAISTIAFAPSPDLSTEAAGFFAIASATVLILRASRNPDLEEARWEARAAALLAVMSLTFKVNTAPLGVAITIAAVILLKRDTANPGTKVGSWVGLALFCLGSVSIWSLRTALLTGYPLFPNLWPALPVQWRVPARHASWILWWVGRYAWYGGSDVASRWTAWTRNELAAGPAEIWLPVLLLLIGIVTRGPGRRGASAPGSSARFTVALGVAAAVAVWAVVAPSRHFAMTPLWLAALVTWEIRTGHHGARLSDWWRLVFVAGCAAAPLALATAFAARHSPHIPDAGALARALGVPDQATCEMTPIYRPRLHQERPCSTLAVWTGNDGVSGPVVRVGDWRDSVPWTATPPASRCVLPGVCTQPDRWPSSFLNSLSEDDWARFAAPIERELSSAHLSRDQIANALVVAPEYLRLTRRPPAPTRP